MKKLLLLLPLIALPACAAPAIPVPEHPVPVMAPEPQILATGRTNQDRFLCYAGLATSGIAEVVAWQDLGSVITPEQFKKWFWYEAAPAGIGGALAGESCSLAFNEPKPLQVQNTWIYYWCGKDIQGFQLKNEDLDYLKIFWTFSCDQNGIAYWPGSFIN